LNLSIYIKPWQRTLLVLFTLIGIAPSLVAQQFKVEAYTDTNAILIGDHITLTLLVTNRFEKQVLWPEIGDTITSSVEVLARSNSDTLKRSGDGTLEIARVYQITSFDSGYFIIPPFRFAESDDSSNYSETEPILIEVHTVEVDTAQAIKDIKTPYDVPYTWDEFITHGLVLLGVIISALLGYFIYKKIKNRPVRVIAEPEITIDPHVLALENLEALERKKLWQQDKVKLYYTELTDIIRIYIESRFHIIAMEMTSDEIMSSMSYVSIAPASKEKLQQLLLIADMVKFAKSKPLSGEHELCMAHAFNIIRETIPNSAPAEKESELVANTESS